MTKLDHDRTSDQPTAPQDVGYAPVADIEATASVDSHELSRYLHHIAHLDMPLEYKIELLGYLQRMMQSFVDRAFGDDASQLASIVEAGPKTVAGDAKIKSILSGAFLEQIESE